MTGLGLGLDCQLTDCPLYKMWFFFWAENGFKLEKGKESELVSERFALVLDGLPDKQTTIEGIQKNFQRMASSHVVTYTQSLFC